MMNVKMKGLLRGLRYISQIFEPSSKEPEMEIGYPTDVKHVAHIGWDGQSVKPPTWMNEFRSAPLSSLGGGEVMRQDDSALETTTTTLPFSQVGQVRGSPAREIDPKLPRPTRRRPNNIPDDDSPTRDRALPLPELPLPKPLTRRQGQPRAASVDLVFPVDSAGASSAFSPGGVAAVRRGFRSTEPSPAGSPDDGSSPDGIGELRRLQRVSRPDHLPAVPKQQRRKKKSPNAGAEDTSGSSGQSSSRSAASRDVAGLLTPDDLGSFGKGSTSTDMQFAASHVIRN